jgi:ATP-dependent helicase HrpA
VMPLATDATLGAFADLLAAIMPFDLVIDETTAEGQPARVSRSSVCGSWGAIAGTLRYFADRWGVPRAAIEGTQIPMDRIRKYATRTVGDIVYAPGKRALPFAREVNVEYFGFTLERELEPLDASPPPDVAARLKREYTARRPRQSHKRRKRRR